MDDLIWVVIYVVIMVVGFLVKQVKRSQVRPSQPQTKLKPQVTGQPAQDLSVKFEQYFTQIEKAFTSPQPPVLPQPSQKAEMVSELVRDKEYQLSEGPRKQISVATPPIEEDVMVGTSVSSPGSLVFFKRPWSVVQGLVMAEVLGPPVSKRHGRGRMA